MRVIVAGSRTFDDYSLLCATMNKFVDGAVKVDVISGGARGADSLGERWALELDCPDFSITRMPADWDRHGKSAGYRRNEEMAKIATHCVVFWDGQSRGSKHMIDLAGKYNLPTLVVQF